jgi:hypothetical protein
MLLRTNVNYPLYLGTIIIELKVDCLLAGASSSWLAG